MEENSTLSHLDTEALLKDLNDKKAVSMIPVMFYLVILMVMGLTGNGMVCYYYGRKTRRTTNSIFICTVAIYDLISCCLSIPIELADLRLFYMFTSSSACKFLRFINHFAAIGSALTLLVIAVDRYNRICRPFKKQLTIKESKIACAVSIIVSIFFSWPAFVFYNSVSVNVKNTLVSDLIGSDCTTIRDTSYKAYIWFYNGVHFLLFIGSVVILCVMYSLVGRVLLKHKQSRQQYPTPSSSNGNTTCSSTDETLADTAEQLEIANDTKETPAGETNKTIGNGKTHNTKPEIKSVSDLSKMKLQKVDQFDIKTIKYTMIMLVITIVFVVSFLPYLILVIWRAFLGQYEGDVLSDGGLVAFQVGIRSYFLNSAINPLTYGFFNSKFRKFFYTVLCPCRYKGVEKSALSTSSGT